jgi:hypothetical protein
MKHAIERRDLKQPLHEYMVRSVNVGKAAATLNDMLHELPVSPQRERTAVEIWRKLVPSMAAIAVEHHHEGPASVHDLNAMLISSGLDALPTNGQVIDSTVEKDDPA